jgi:hypothetical protein
MSDNLVGRYLGQTDCNGLRTGKGKLTLFNGDIFEGNWKDDILEEGTFTTLTGNVYSGSFNKNGEKHGNGNFFNKVTGDRYEGAFENDMKHGTGKLYRSNGDCILGKWVHGIELKSQVMVKFKNGDTYTGAVNDKYQKQGYGKLICYVGEYLNVEGEFFEDEMHGRVKINYRSGKKLDAHFMKGILNGQAHIVYENGDVLDCEFSDNKKNGYGSHIRRKGERYDGYFVNDNREGSGVCTFEDGSCYDGEWLDGKMNGKGKFTTSDGGVCHTTWKNGKKEGDGEYILPNGAIIKGKFSGDELREGTCTFSNGDIYQGPFKKFKPETNALKNEVGNLTGKNYLYRGEFKNGKRHGHGRIDYADGAYYEGEYKDDLKHGQGIFEMKG